MVYQWEPDTQYNHGDVVIYEGHKYQIVQPHRSQSDWTPPVTPALWTRLPEEYVGSSPGYQAPPAQQPQQPQQAPPPEKSWDEHTHQTVDIPPEEKEKNWWDLDEKRKKELEIGGGLALGAALLGGGLFAYNHHKKGEEEKKATAWGLQNWLKDAQARTQQFHQYGPQGPVTWVLVQGNNFPPNPFPGGEEDGRTLYIARAFHEGSIQVGKTAAHWSNGAVIGYAHKEISVPTFEILLADPRAVRWVDAKGHFKPQSLDVRPVEAGREADGTPIFIAQAHHNNSVHPGKASSHLDGAFITYGGTEKEIDHYRVLCYV